MVIDISYKDSAEKFNRIRWQKDNGTPSRTLAQVVEIEGEKIRRTIDGLAEDILESNHFTKEGKPLDNADECGIEKEAAALAAEKVKEAVLDYNKDKDDHLKIDLEQVEGFYENPDYTTNISIDDVGVKRQKETGRSSAKVKKPKKEYVHNTIVHVESQGKRYILNAVNTVAIIPLLVAFLLNNSLMKQYITFYVDGARTLQAALLSRFGWLKSYRIILDWYHIEKKCKYELSLALRGIKIKNSILDEILPLLWLGKVDVAISVLKAISLDNIKPGQSVDRLIGYFERNRDYIPCYALRKKLGIRNSSNKGEKANDLIVADRQKHNGMSWSKDGSVALATITGLHLNKEDENWYCEDTIDFKYVA
jgi:hypothetical protein